MNHLHATLYSIYKGKIRPKRLILWLDDPDQFSNLPARLERLVRRGLEVRLTNNLGPHTKYWPWVSEQSFFEEPLVTADDDVIYPKTWLSDLLDAYSQRSEDTILCHRAHKLSVTAAGIGPYREWPPCHSTNPSITHFATGVSGVLYPPAFLSVVAGAGQAFLELCPRADDVWLHKLAVSSGYRIQQLSATAKLYPTVPHSQRVSLLSENVAKDANDPQIAATYSEEDVQRLIAALTSHIATQ